MKVVIDVPENYYYSLAAKEALLDKPLDYIQKIILDGTPLPKGRWIKYGPPRCGEQHYKCTACDDYINFGVYSDYYLKAFKYCPNCGAKMEEK